MDGLMNSVSLQMQRAISEAINEHVFHKFNPLSGPVPGKCHKKRDGMFLQRDRNRDPKELSTARSEIFHGMSSSESRY